MRRTRARFTSWWEDRLARFGSVTKLIIWTCIGVFLLQLIGWFVRWPVVDWLFALSTDGLRHGFVWQPLSYMFLHDTGNLLHIVFNLLLLWFFGREVESFVGPKRFLRLYLVGGLLGGLLWLGCQWFLEPPGYSPALLGASAAVLACVIAFATLFPEQQITLLLFFVLPVRIKAKYIALVAVALDLIPVLQRAEGDVAHLAHLGGMAFGYIYIKQLGYGRTPRWLEAIESLGRAFKPKRRPTQAADGGAGRGGRGRFLETSSTEAYIREQVDPILDKISREGIHSLNDDERRILESAKDLLKKRQG